jgi:hypothetical protein
MTHKRNAEGLLWLSMLMSALTLLSLACNNKPTTTRAAPSEEEPSGPPWFEDITSTSGVSFTYINGEDRDHYAILESLGGGLGLIDFDGDGLQDLFLPGGGRYGGNEGKEILGTPCKFYRNLGGGKFKEITAEVGLDRLAGGKPWYYTHGVAVADYDRDGYPDLLVTGYGRLALFHNEADGKGGRRFREVTGEAGLERGHFWGTSAAWADLDGDGYPELYVCQYVDWSFKNNPFCSGYTTNVKRDVCPPKQFNAVPHALYHNVANSSGGRKFADISKSAGLRVERADSDHGKGLGVLIVDINLDGKPDIYVANDTTDNFLYINESTPGKVRLVERGFEMGVARDGNGTPNGSMGIDAADFDHSGLPSIWVTNYEGELHALYRNTRIGKRQFFNYYTQAAGLAVIGQNYVGFGTMFADMDGDGNEDIVISNGHVIRHPYRAGLAQKPVLFRNEGKGSFVEWTRQGGSYFQAEHRGRGVAVGDLDNDGKPDLVFSHANQPVRLLRNVAPWRHWLGIELVGHEHRHVVGARIIVEAGGQKQTRFIKGGGSYLTSSDSRQRFGLGEHDRVDRVTVHWPSGEPAVQQFTGLAVDRYWRLVQGEKTPLRSPKPAG